MIYKNLFLLAMLSFCIFGYSQDYEIVYKVNFRPQKSSKVIKTEYMALQNSDKQSLFYNLNLKKDSAQNSKISEKPYLKFTILNDFKTNTYYGTFNGFNFKYTEPIPQHWKILNKTSDYESYKTQEASLEFEGRKWIALFAPEISVFTGPYKFSGLPGLILKVFSEDGDYSFEMVELSKNKKHDDSKILNSQSAFIKKKDLEKMISEFIKDPGSHNIVIMVSENDRFDYEFSGQKDEAYKDMNNYVNDLISKYDNPIDKKTYLLVY